MNLIKRIERVTYVRDADSALRIESHKENWKVKISNIFIITHKTWIS